MSRSGQPALLQIAPSFAAKPTAGAQFRNLYLGTRLASHMAVTHVGYLPAGYTGAPPEPPPETPESLRMVAVSRTASYRIPDLAAGFLGTVPFSVLNYTRAEMRDAIARLLERHRFDFILVEGIQLGEYLPLLRSGAPHAVVVSDWHNIESEILERYGETAANPVRKLYARVSAGKLKRYERRFTHRCDMHITVSERDRDTLLHEYGARVPVEVIENGVPVDYLAAAPAESRQRFRVVFMGSMDYHANIEAVTCFAREVWPDLRAANPSLVFTIVGRTPAPAVLALASEPGIEVTGTVADVRPYYREAAAAVVPLRVGGGTRIKILEAMAASVPVISSSLGAEGLQAVPKEHYLPADSSAEMAAALRLLLNDPAMAGRLAAAARDFVRRHHDWNHLGDRLAGFLQALPGKMREVELPG